jgi:hypothetical protein
VVSHYHLGQEVQIQRSGGVFKTSTGTVQAVEGDVVRVQCGDVILKFSSSTGDMLPRLKDGQSGLHLQQSEKAAESGEASSPVRVSGDVPSARTAHEGDGPTP